MQIKGQGPATDCDAAKNDNAGCSVTDWSRASYGPYFDDQGGGVFAMKWDENGIAVCKLCPGFGSYVPLTTVVQGHSTGQLFPPIS